MIVSGKIKIFYKKLNLRLKNILSYQYEQVKGSREVIFRFCESFNPLDLTKEIKGFGRGPIANTLIHIANTYTFWVANSIMEKSLPYLDYEPTDVITIRKAFETVNSFMEKFINVYSKNIYDTKLINIKDGSDKISVTLLQVFTHVITHEFHHKGQIMSMGRQLGYIPPDADIIRFS